MKIRLLGAELIHAGEQTETTKLIADFCKYCEQTNAWAILCGNDVLIL